MISAVPSVSSVHVELDGRLPSTAGRTDETTKVLRRDLFPEYKRINHKMKFWEVPSIFLVLFEGSFKDPRYCSPGFF
jgi:hypothetical protein